MRRNKCLKKAITRGLTAALVCSVIFTTNLTVNASSQLSASSTLKYGDLDNDGEVNAIDFASLKGHLLGIRYIEGNALIAADCDGDGSVDVLDLSLIKSKLLGMLDKFPVEENSSSSTNLYVSPNGNDSNTGSADTPFKTISKAISLSVPGTSIYLYGGIYTLDTTINLSSSGTEAKRISILAYPGEKPVLDYSSQIYASGNRGIVLTGDYWSLKGLEICYAGDNGIKLEGSYNIIENCVFHHNGDSGIQLGFGHQDPNPDGALCAYNKIINCDSYMNFDFDNAGSDADGFACKMHNGKGNLFSGCRSWRNGDDGWDLFETDWAVEIINCWTWHNGDKADFDTIYEQKMGKKMSSYQGNGNGFKLGGNGTGGSSKGQHIVRNCISFDNNYRSKKGFDQNSHKGGVIVENCVSFGNGYNYMFEDSAPNVLNNNISFGVRGSLDHEFASGTIEQNNSWNLTVTADAYDFASLSENLALAPRNPDGSLPDNSFAKLVSGSDLIDKGIDVGLPYKGIAPDLGAFEY